MRKKVRSYLKGLAENRARAAGDVVRLEAMAAQVAKELAEARMDVESCNRLIKKYDSRLRPELIEPIREWCHHKGKRGDLKILLLADQRTAQPNRAGIRQQARARGFPPEYPSQWLQVGLAEASPALRALTANSHRTTAAPLLKCLVAHRLSCSSRLD